MHLIPVGKVHLNERMQRCRQLDQSPAELLGAVVPRAVAQLEAGCDGEEGKVDQGSCGPGCSLSPSELPESLTFTAGAKARGLGTAQREECSRHGLGVQADGL